MSATFSSFISCYSLCIKLGFQSDAVHRLENYPKISLQQSVVPQSQLSSNLARDVKPRNWRAGGGGGGEQKNGSASNRGSGFGRRLCRRSNKDESLGITESQAHTGALVSLTFAGFIFIFCSESNLLH